MENRITKLKNNFVNITTIRSNVKSVFDILQIRINKLKIFYSEFIKNNKNKLFVFGLDSFHFQNKLIDIEYEDMKRLFLAINNRMYCEYFKLYKIITEYIYENINDKKITEIIKVNNFPVYKDLEPFKEYDFEIITEVHENILIIVNSIISNLNTRENELNIHRSKQEIGLNIDNFITSYNFELTVMREKIIMFLTYIEFFHQLHTKNLKRFSNKIHLMYTHINNDIRFDESVEINKDKKQEINEEFVEDININEIKVTIQENITTENTNLNKNDNVIAQIITTNNINIITDDESVDLINTILEINDNDNKNTSDANKTPLSYISNKSSSKTQFNKIENKEQINNEIVYDNFKNINESCDSLLSKDNIYKDQNNIKENNIYKDNNNLKDDNVNKGSEVSDISDDISVMSEIIIDELDITTNDIITNDIVTINNNIEPPKPKRGRKKKN